MSYRYIGNKSRLAGQLVELVADVASPGARVADLMCGTGAVAAALAGAGYRVHANDLMTFAYLHARVRLHLGRAPRFTRLKMPYRGVLAHLEGLRGRKGYFHREYGAAGRPANGAPPRKYFSATNAAQIDAINHKLRAWSEEGLLTRDEHDLLRHDLVLAANRVANIAGTYGHYWSQWGNGALEALELRPSRFERAGRSLHTVSQGRAEDISSGLRSDVCYLDPPYTKRQYAANYHIIETLSRGDEPSPQGISGLRPWRDQYSDFCSKVRIRGAFTEIFEGMHCPQFLISYSEDGLLGRDEMTSFLRQFGRVSTVEFRLQRFRSNQSPLGRELTEYVFVLTRR